MIINTQKSNRKILRLFSCVFLRENDGMRGVNMAAQGVLTTLCYLERDDAYLMLHRVKKKNDVNHDKWIGIGGKFEGVESPEECLLREAKEETGLTLTDYRLRGIVTFISSEPWDAEYMFLYTATGWTGEMQECSEGTLEWVPKKDIEKLNLWEGDKLFLRLMEEDRAVFSLKLRYDKDQLVEAVLDGKVLIL